MGCHHWQQHDALQENKLPLSEQSTCHFSKQFTDHTDPSLYLDTDLTPTVQQYNEIPPDPIRLNLIWTLFLGT